VNVFVPERINRPSPSLLIAVDPEPGPPTSVLAIVAMTPEFTVNWPPPKLMLPPLSVTLPSSKMKFAVAPPLPTVWVPLTVMVYVPVASLPAANTAVLPDTHAPVETVPSADVLQNVLLPFQVPLGDPLPPAPVVAPFMSQYKFAARDNAGNTAAVAAASRQPPRRRRRPRSTTCPGAFFMRKSKGFLLYATRYV
jgi:hypothetical protein